MNIGKNSRHEIFPILFIFLPIIIYRFWILVKYSAKWTDDDQALMWYGTVLFSKGVFPEPCFFGQSYGTMLESLIAVPFYWLKIPLNIALPLSSIIVSLIPVILIFNFIKNYYLKILAVCLWAFFGYRFDILFSIPRSLFPGISVTTIGCAFIIISSEEKFRKIVGAFLALLGVFLTSNAIVLLPVAGIFVIYENKLKLKKYLPYIFGFIIALPYKLYTIWFYKENPDFAMHGSGGISWSEKVLMGNLSNIYDAISQLNCFHSVLISIVFFFFLIIFFAKKNYNCTLLATLASFFVVMLFFGLTKTSDFYDTLLFSQLRMLLFLPYLPLLILLVLDKESQLPELENYKVPLFVCSLVFLVFSCSYKIHKIKDLLKLSPSELTSSAVVNVLSVEDAVNRANRILDYANENMFSESDKELWIVTVTDARAQAYALGALGDKYKKYHFYHTIYDRRTWEFINAQKTQNVSILITEWTPDDVNFKLFDDIDSGSCGDGGGCLMP